MEKWKKRSIDLLTSLAFGTDGTPSVVPYYPQKTRVSGAEERFFRRATPESHGISSKRIYNMLASLEAEKRARKDIIFTEPIHKKEEPPQKVTVVRGGIDIQFLVLVIALVAFGATMSFSASYFYASQEYGDSFYFVTRYVKMS